MFYVYKFWQKRNEGKRCDVQRQGKIEILESTKGTEG